MTLFFIYVTLSKQSSSRETDLYFSKRTADGTNARDERTLVRI